ncbi:MAG: hypothetical protein AAF413_02200 [Patescibacteria group bacterium]
MTTNQKTTAPFDPMIPASRPGSHAPEFFVPADIDLSSKAREALSTLLLSSVAGIAMFGAGVIGEARMASAIAPEEQPVVAGPSDDYTQPEVSTPVVVGTTSYVSGGGETNEPELPIYTEAQTDESVAEPAVLTTFTDLFSDREVFEVGDVMPDLSNLPELNGVSPERSAFIINELLSREIDGRPISIRGAVALTGMIIKESKGHPNAAYYEDAQPSYGLYQAAGVRADGLPQPAQPWTESHLLVDSPVELGADKEDIITQITFMLEDLQKDHNGPQIAEWLTSNNISLDELMRRMGAWIRPLDPEDERVQYAWALYYAISNALEVEAAQSISI